MSSHNWHSVTAEARLEQKLWRLVAAINEEQWAQALTLAQEDIPLVLQKYVRPAVPKTHPALNRLWDDFEDCMKHICSTIRVAVDLITVANKLKKVAIQFVEEDDDKQSADLLLEEVHHLNSATLLELTRTTHRLLNQLCEKKSEIKEMSKQMPEQPQC
jgi:hypothetical protein